MSQPKLTLRPPPHRDFIQGFPGIPSSSHIPAAHVAGTVEVRLGTKGLSSAWLRIELRKLETLPNGESWGELIGKGPIDVWTARTSNSEYKSDSEKGWELLQTADFPFTVAIPEGLPPSAKLEKNAGIGYELVTSLCVKTKKGLLKKETTSSIIQNTHPLWLDKHELHSTWPIYASPEDHEAIQDDIIVKVMRERTCYGPGDSIDVRIVVSSGRVSPMKIKSVSASVRETITFKGSAKKSNKPASQKTETLSNKSKSFGKKIYKGDSHTFDLACQIPRTHSLMTIQTAKHIEVSYSMRVTVETAKKPIIIDHLPVTISNFTRSTSDALMGRIGWVPGLSAPTDPNEGRFDEYAAPDNAILAAQQGGVARSISFSDSTYSGGRGYPGYPGGDLRRRDTVMTQGTAVSGPGMAGRGVPGQVFSWGQYGSAQPFGAGEAQAPRPAFAGPPSIYDGYELQPEENRALFHSTNRPQSEMMLGTAVDPVLMNGSSYHGHSGGVTPIMERSEDGHGSMPPSQQFVRGPMTPQSQQQHDIRRHSEYASHYGGEQRYPASPQASPYAEIPNRYSATPELGTTRYVRPEPVHQPIVTNRLSSPAPQANGAAMSSAEAEKQQLYERARQQAERNQRRADERRATSQSAASSAANGGRPYSMMNLASSSNASPAPNQSAVGNLSAEAEKMRLFERARSEAERYQTGYSQGTMFPSQGGVEGMAASGSSSAQTVSSTMVSGRPAPYQSYMTAEEEKRQLYEKAKAEADAFQRGDSPSAAIAGGSVSGHRQAASMSNGSVHPPGAWPAGGSSSSSSAPPPAAVAGSSSGGAAVVPPISEKEQLRRYYEAREAVSQHLSHPPADPVYAPEVASAVHHATPHQPADTVPTPPRTTPTSEVPLSASTPFRPNQSYLTQAEQQSAEEKERLASHYARKTAKAEAKAAAKANGNGQGAVGVNGGSEKAQLAAYYAARDAMEANLGSSQAAAGGSGSGTATPHQIPELIPASPIVFPASSSTAVPLGAVPGSSKLAANGNIDQWRPKYNSLYEDEDDLGNGLPSSSAAPPPLPPKIPIGSGFRS